MEVKYVVVLYTKYYCGDPTIRKEYEFYKMPTDLEIKDIVDGFELSSYDYEIDYSTGAILPDYSMPKKCKIQSIWAVVEKRYYKNYYKENDRCHESIQP